MMMDNEIQTQNKHYYVMLPENDATDYMAMLKELYPKDTLSMATAEFTPVTQEGEQKDIEIFDVIVRVKNKK